MAVAHRHAETDALHHFDVVEAVAERHHVFHIDAEFFNRNADAACFRALRVEHINGCFVPTDGFVAVSGGGGGDERVLSGGIECQHLIHVVFAVIIFVNRMLRQDFRHRFHHFGGVFRHGDIVVGDKSIADVFGIEKGTHRRHAVFIKRIVVEHFAAITDKLAVDGHQQINAHFFNHRAHFRGHGYFRAAGGNGGEDAARFQGAHGFGNRRAQGVGGFAV